MLSVRNRWNRVAKKKKKKLMRQKKKKIKCLGNHSAIIGSVLYMKVVPDKI